ncbi:MAG: hypothetical protein LBF12_07765 [Christensenellaceae bacterium]|nr:hypothetical protein [Christensenellaceae bacterium]
MSLHIKLSGVYEKKIIQIIISFVILIPIGIFVCAIGDDMDVTAKHYFNLYDNVEAADMFLHQAYWFETLKWLTASLGMLLFVFLVSICTIITKYNSSKYNIIFIFIAVASAAILVPVSLCFGAILSLHKFIVILDVLLSSLICLAYIFTSDHSHNKLIKKTDPDA